MKKINHILFLIGTLTLLLSPLFNSIAAASISPGNPIVRQGQPTAMLPSVSTKPVTDITSTSATSGGTVLSDGGAAVTARGVCWSTESAPTIANSHTVDGSGTGSFNSTIEGLTPGQTYYVRAYATNSEGTSYGQELQFSANCQIVTLDTLHISPNEMPFVYADTVIDIGTPDSSNFIFHNLSIDGCDSISKVLFTYRASYRTACFQYYWWVSQQTYTESGMYLHHYFNTQGDLAADTLFLTIINPTVTLSPIAPVAVCPGEAIAFNATAASTGQVSYNWMGPDNFSGTGNSVSIPNAVPANAGTYTVTASVTEGQCTATVTSSVSVTVYTPPTISISGNDAVCMGNSTTLTAGGAASYRWNTGASAASITVTPALSTTYSVTGTDNHGCMGTASVAVAVNPLPNMGISGGNAVCAGKSVTLKASGASSYVWSTGATGPSITQTLNSTTSYSVTGTNTYGCSATATSTVTVHALPVVDISGEGSVCEGQSITLNASGASTYAWSTGATSPSLTLMPTGSGTYSVTGTSAYGCSATATKSVTVNPAPVMSISGGTSICAGGSVTLTASGASSYTWAHGKTGNTITETPAGSTSYMVQGTDDNGCTATASTDITVFSLPNVYISGIGEICENESVTLTATGAQTYTWSTGSGANSITETPATTTSYSVTGTDINQCHGYATVIVTVNELPIITIIGDDEICEGESTLLTAHGADTYVWNDGSTENFLLVEPDVNTTYSVVGTDINGCSNNAAFSVEVGEGDDDEVSASACEIYYWHVSGEFYHSSGTYVYNYENDQGCLSHHILHLTITHADTNEVSVTKCDSYTWGSNGQTYTESGTYTHTFVNPNNCETMNILNLTIKHGTETEETVSECENYLWPANGQTYTQSGDYVFEYTGQNGCPSTKTLHLTIKQGTQEEVSASSVNSYTWAANGMTYTQSGDYVHHFTNEDGCASTLTLHLTIRHEPDSDCIRIVMEKKESCYPGEDGIAFVYIPNALKNRCEVEWQLAGGISHDERVTNLKKGTYHVKVKGNDCPNVIFFQGSIEVPKEDGCDVSVHISGPTNVQGDCNGIPPVTFTAHASGGVPPYSFPGWQKISNNTATKTFAPENGQFSVSCTVFDSQNSTGTDYLDGYAKKLECSQDPNEIKGPNGYSDEQRFVNGSDKMNYTIEFENDPEFAMAPASRVKITYDVPAKQRLSSFRLSDFGFGSFIFTVPSNVSSYSQRLDVSDSLGVWVDVNAGIDILNHQLFWIFQSIDPATGAEPASSQMGFLPVNDTLEHGQGYVSFYILPENGVQTGDTVAAEALIVFDENESIGTNVWRNTFDAVAPTSTLHAELNAQDSLYCTFSFSAQDDAGGSGVASVETFVSVNNNAYTSIGSCHPDSTLTFALENGLYYQFMSIATDYVGNTETFKSLADTAVNYNTAPIDIVLDGTVFYENVPLSTFIGTLMTLDNDINQTFDYELVSGEGSADNSLFQITGNSLRTNSLFECSHRTEYFIRVKSTDLGGLSTEKAFVLNEILTHEAPVTYLNETVCQGESYDFHGVALTSAGIYTDTLSRSDGCDSIVTLFLSVSPVHHTVIADEICPGGSYFFFGKTLTEAGTYHDTLQTANGCDSIFTLNLTVNPVYNTPLFHGICDGDSYDFFGQELTESGTYNHTLQSIHGCDSVITLSLTVNPVYNTPISHTICEGDSYDFFGQALTTAGTYTHTLQSVNHCDSIITLTLTVNPVFNTPMTHTMCDGDSYDFFGQTLTAAGTYTHTLQSVLGCDSVITLTLTVNPTYNLVYDLEICEGESLDFNGEVITEAGTYTQTSQTLNGCDSIVSIVLTVNPVYNTPVSEEICEGDSYDFFGQALTTAGTYTHTLQSVHGCDSVITLTLAVNPVFNTPVEAVICNGDSYDFFGQTLTTAGIYTHTLQTVHGCDSVVTLTLTVNPVYNTPVTHTMCDGDSYDFFGQTLTTAGTYTHVMQTVNGCDSVFTLTLTVNPVFNTPVTTEICNGDSYDFFGQTITTAGTFTHTLQSVHGCDSVITLTLTTNPVFNTPVEAVICEGGSYDFFGQTLTTAGTYTHTLQSIHGCDSVITLTLTVNPVFNTPITAEICDGSSYDFFGQTISTAGAYTHTLQSVNGCDSVITLTLTVNPVFNTPFAAEICDGDSYTFFGQTLTTAGSYTHTLQSVNGCDSVITLTLTVNPVFNTPVSAEICDGGSYDFFGQTLTTAGSYTHTLQSVHGCDSVIALTLTVLYGTHNVETETECENFTWHGVTYNTSGTYTYEYTNANGCASVDTLHLTILPTVAETVEATACDSYTWNGSTYTTSGEYVQTFTNADGCDSVVTLNLTIHYSTVSDFTITTADSCYEWNAVTYCESGDYTQTMQTVDGCDSVVTLHLTITVGIDDHDLSGIEVFPNPTNHILNIKGENMRKICIYNANGQLLFTKEDLVSDLQQVDVTRFASGQYFLKVQLDDGHTVTRKFIVSRR